MSGLIASVDALEGVIGKTPSAMHLKVIDHLDAGALRWIAAAPVMFAGFGDGSCMGVTLGGGAPGFAQGDAELPFEGSKWLRETCPSFIGVSRGRD